MSFSLMWLSYILSSVPTNIDKPNIIFLLADDLGWNDVGWHNSDVKTPNLDRLAYSGVILDRAYVKPICTPSRTALLTGRYPFTLGMQHGALKRDKPRGIPLDQVLLPQVLHQLGYSTHIIGKWHLGFCKWDYTPTYRGFDTFLGYYSGGQDYYTHMAGEKYVKGYDYRFNTKVFHPKKPRYSTVPARFERQYANVRDKNRRVYSAMVTAMDDAVGRIVTSLIRHGHMNNTLIIFTSDNGGAPNQGGNNWPLRGGKSSVWEGGTRAPTFVWGSMLNKRGYVNKGIMHMVDWFPTILDAIGVTDDVISALSRRGGHFFSALDGVSQWSMIRDGDSSNRNEFVYAINEVIRRAAIRWKQFKLIEGFPGHYTHWYAPSYYKGRNVSYRKRKKVRKSSLHRHSNSTLLYDVENDPVEFYDLADKMPDLVHFLKEKLRAYKERLVPANNPRKIRKAHPEFWGGNWSPGWC